MYIWIYTHTEYFSFLSFSSAVVLLIPAHPNHLYSKVRIQFRAKQDDADSVCNQIHTTHCCFIITCYFHLHFHA